MPSARLRSGPSDLVGVLEAVYDLDTPHTEWLSNLTHAVAPVMDQGFGTMGYTVLPTGHPERLKDLTVVGGSEGLERVPRMGADQVLEEKHWEPLFRTVPRVSWASDSVPKVVGTDRDFVRFFGELADEFGFDDVLGLTAWTPIGRPVQFTFPAHHFTLGKEERRRWEQLGAHIEAGLRLRQADEAAEAVLSPTGNVLHAEGKAVTKTARTALKEAERRRSRSRGVLRKQSPDEALSLWNALVQGRWTIVDHVDTDGQRFVLARRNDAAVPEQSLTVRERQVARLAAMGLSGKIISYELGISPSTVSSTLRSLLKRLNLRTRFELASLVRTWS